MLGRVRGRNPSMEWGDPPLIMIPDTMMPRHIGEPEICAPSTSPMRPEPGPAQPLSQGADAVAAYFIPVVSVAVRLSRSHAAEHERDRQGQRSFSQHNSVSPDC